jgi:cell division protein FtsL
MALKFKRAGTITKFVLLILGVYMAILLLSVRTQIRSAEADLRALQTQVDEQTAANASLAADIANRNDPDTVLAIAKERMRLVESGEIIFYDTTN